jgi:hypothetical protein
MLPFSSPTLAVTLQAFALQSCQEGICAGALTNCGNLTSKPKSINRPWIAEVY